MVSGHAVPHRVRPAAHSQLALRQSSSLVHALPQPPQFMRSVLVSTQPTPTQSERLPVHMQVPPSHTPPAPQDVPHAPQLFALVLVSTHESPQRVVVAEQFTTQAPDSQT